MIFSIENEPEIEKRREKYHDWKITGIPVAQDCPCCSAQCMRVKFLEEDRSKFRVICEHCGSALGSLR